MVVLLIRVVELTLDRSNAGTNGLFALIARHDRGAVLADRDPTRPSQVLHRHLVEGHRPVFADDLTAGEHCDVGKS